MATASNTRHSMTVERWGSAKLAATPATNSVTGGNATAPAASITTTAPNSVLSWVSADINSTDPATRAYLLGATEGLLFDGHVGANSVQYGAYALVGAAGAYTIGMSAPTNQHWVMAGVEVQAGNTVVSGSTSDTLTVTDSAARTAILARATADTLTITDAATRAALVLVRSATNTLTITDRATGINPNLSRDLLVKVYPPQTRWAAVTLPGRWAAYPPQTRWAVVLMPASMSVASLQYVRVRVTASTASGAINPSTDVVSMASVAPGVTPAVADWQTASWDSSAPTTPSASSGPAAWSWLWASTRCG